MAAGHVSCVAGAKSADLKQRCLLGRLTGIRSCIASILLDVCWAEGGPFHCSKHTRISSHHSVRAVVQAASSPSYQRVAVGWLFVFLFVCCSRLLEWLQEKEKTLLSCVGPLHVSIRKLESLVYTSFFLFLSLSAAIRSCVPCSVFRVPPPFSCSSPK